MVLSDNETILGVQYKGVYNLIKKENMNGPIESIFSYKGNEDSIYTMLLNEKTSTFLVGEDNNDNGKLLKYDLINGKIIKDYGSLGIRSIFSSTRLNNICFFSGHGCQSFTIINDYKNNVIFIPIKSAIQYNQSIEICEVKDLTNKTSIFMLVVTGNRPDYSNNKTDIFNVTSLIENQCIFPKNVCDSKIFDNINKTILKKNHNKNQHDEFLKQKKT